MKSANFGTRFIILVADVKSAKIKEISNHEPSLSALLVILGRRFEVGAGHPAASWRTGLRNTFVMPIRSLRGIIHIQILKKTEKIIDQIKKGAIQKSAYLSSYEPSYRVLVVQYL